MGNSLGRQRLSRLLETSETTAAAGTSSRVITCERTVSLGRRFLEQCFLMKVKLYYKYYQVISANNI